MAIFHSVPQRQGHFSYCVAQTAAFYILDMTVRVVCFSSYSGYLFDFSISVKNCTPFQQVECGRGVQWQANLLVGKCLRFLFLKDSTAHMGVCNKICKLLNAKLPCSSELERQRLYSECVYVEVMQLQSHEGKSHLRPA